MKIIPKLRRRPIVDISAFETLNIPPILKYLYVHRGIRDVNQIERSMHNLISYHQLPGINHAAALLAQALMGQYRFMVIGDFDVDGATGTALMIRSLKYMGAKFVEFLIPNRLTDGYGLTSSIVDQASARGAEIIITVDNGISSHSGVIRAHQKGILVIITDHHLPEKILPEADAIVNPNLYEWDFNPISLSGVGVAFYLMLALRAKLNVDGWFSNHGILVPKLGKLLDLVALGTVADLVPMNANNRILVYQGIKRIRHGYCSLGIKALIEVSNCNASRIISSDLSFAIAPRLNAAGRIEDMSIGVELMLTDDKNKARLLAVKLDKLNQKRKIIERNMETQALELCNKIAKCGMPFGLAIYHKEWHQGVIGILAARLKERFYSPVIAFAPDKDDKKILKGSGRSISGLHMYDLLEKINKIYPGMIVKFGGHAMAIGLSLLKEQFEKFNQCFMMFVNQWLDTALFEDHIIWSDGELSDHDISFATADILRNGGPWGPAFPYPIFDGKFRVLDQRIIGNNHLKLILQPLAGGMMINGIAFNFNHRLLLNDRSLSISNSSYKLDIVKLAYQLNTNKFQNHHNIEFVIQYIWVL